MHGNTQSPWGGGGQSPGCMENDEGTRILLNRSLTVLSEMYMYGRGHYLGKVIFDPYEPPDKDASL